MFLASLAARFTMGQSPRQCHVRRSDGNHFQAVSAHASPRFSGCLGWNTPRTLRRTCVQVLEPQSALAVELTSVSMYEGTSPPRKKNI